MSTAKTFWPKETGLSKNPKDLHRYALGGNILRVWESGATFRHDESFSFWTAIARSGSFVTMTSNVEATICNISGSGKLYHIIGPLASGTHTVTFSITIDGVETIFEHTYGGNIRFCFGSLQAMHNNTHVSFQRVTSGHTILDGSATIQTPASTHWTNANVVTSGVTPLIPNGGIIRFDKSLTIKMLHTSVNTASTQYRNGGVVYYLD